MLLVVRFTHVFVNNNYFVTKLILVCYNVCSKAVLFFGKIEKKGEKSE